MTRQPTLRSYLTNQLLPSTRPPSSAAPVTTILRRLPQPHVAADPGFFSILRLRQPSCFSRVHVRLPVEKRPFDLVVRGRCDVQTFYCRLRLAFLRSILQPSCPASRHPLHPTHREAHRSVHRSSNPMMINRPRRLLLRRQTSLFGRRPCSVACEGSLAHDC